MPENNQIMSVEGQLCGMPLAGPESFSQQQLDYLKRALGVDETVLWSNNNPQYTNDNKGVVSATLPETIANFESVEFWVATNGNSQSTTLEPKDMVFKCTVTNSKAGFFYVIPENSATGNWFKWYGTIDGVTLSATGGYAAASNAGNTTLNGGLWGKGSLYKVVGIHRIAGGNQ